MRSNPGAWFEIPVKDMTRARQFYEAALGLPLAPPQQIGENVLSFFPMESALPGAAGALIQCDRVQPSVHGTTIYFSVPSIEPVLARIAEAGGETCLPKTSIGEHGSIAHFTDTEGNRAALHEAPDPAKACH